MQVGAAQLVAIRAGGTILLMSDSLDWTQIHGSWEFECEQMACPLLNTSDLFLEIGISCDERLRIADEVIDWWPIDDIQSRQASLDRLGSRGVYWETKKGTLHTAQLLWEFRNDKTITSIIWLAAFLFNRLRVNPWKAPAALRQLDEVVTAEFRRLGLSAWHKMSRDAIPISTNLRLDVASEYHEYIRLAMVEAWLSCVSWKLIRVFYMDPMAKPISTTTQ